MTDRSGSGPYRCTHSARDGAATYSVASHCGRCPAWLWSTTAVVQGERTRSLLRISRVNRSSKPGSRPNSARTVFSASGRPETVRDRYTRPMPPSPSLASSG
jgi:hypothetical protein